MKINKFLVSTIDGVLPGGSSKPVLVKGFLESDVTKLESFVVKLYKKNHVLENFTVAKEILISELAKDFDLNVPDYGIIEIDNSELGQFGFTEEEVDNIALGFKFSTFYEDGYSIYSQKLNLKYLQSYDIEKLFAFDNLIMNTDRGGYRNKPNLLINDENILLIDHELTLPFFNNLDKYNENLPNHFNHFNSYSYDKHVFYSHLKSLRNKENKDKPSGFFNEFSENLKTLNIEKFRGFFDEFDRCNITYDNKETFFTYLNWCKNNYQKINDILIKRIS